MSSKKKKVEAWNPDNEPRVAGKLGEGHWYLSRTWNEFHFTVSRSFAKLDEEKKKWGNYFRTEKEAEEAAKSINEGMKEVFESYH